MTNIGDLITEMAADKQISVDLAKKTIEDTVLAAYKRKFGFDNAEIIFSDDLKEIGLYSVREVVDEDEYRKEFLQIPLDDAIEFDPEIKIGDTMLVEIDPKKFDRVSVQSAKQKNKQDIREFQKNALYSHFKVMEGEIINGDCIREKENGDVIISLGKADAILPKRYQSPRDSYTPKENVKSYLEKVENVDRRQVVDIILSRTNPNFVRKLFELEVPEINEGSIEIVNIVRDPGYRTKVAVKSLKDNVNAEGACVGLKGSRIQNVMTELDGEKIDIIKWDSNPLEYIHNALSPATVDTVHILDAEARKALVVVEDSQLSLAIGKGGMNVRLANRLVDWQIDVKTAAQYEELGLHLENAKALDALFNEEEIQEVELPEDEIDIRELDLSDSIVEKLHRNDVYTVEEYVGLENNNELQVFTELTEEEIKEITNAIENKIEFVSDTEVEQVEEVVEEIEEEYVFECPECGHEVTEDMEICPSCGIGLSFEEE